MSKKFTTEDFIRKAQEKHGDTFDYSQVDYVNIMTKVNIMCKKHGVFKQAPGAHYNRGDICPKCSKENVAILMTTSKESFIIKSNIIHNNKFDYSLIEDYKRLDEHLTIICPIHGIFKQNGGSHMRGSGCEKCSYEKRGSDSRIPKTEILERLKSLNNNLKYDLSDYENIKSTISYICPVHGTIRQKIEKQLKGKGCSKCNRLKVWNRSNKQEFIEKAIAVHGENYDYSLVNYKNNSTKIQILCKHHGLFLQRPNNHIDSNAGCPVCAIITSNVREFVDIAETKNISCEVYLFKISGNNEEFYKIGISRHTTKRVKNINTKSQKQYSSIIIAAKQTSLYDAAKLEHMLHKKYRRYRYHPVIQFGGHTECFNIDLPVDNIISSLNQK